MVARDVVTKNPVVEPFGGGFAVRAQGPHCLGGRWRFRLSRAIKKIVQTLRTARSATIEINGQRLTLDPDLTDAARDILKRLESGH